MANKDVYQQQFDKYCGTDTFYSLFISILTPALTFGLLILIDQIVRIVVITQYGIDSITLNKYIIPTQIWLVLFDIQVQRNEGTSKHQHYN